MNIEDEEYAVELSSLSQPYSENGKTVEVEIYKGEDDEGWILEVLDTKGNSMIAEEMFKTDKEAWDQFVLDVKEEGIDTFIRKD